MSRDGVDAIVARAEARPRETFGDPARGDVSWVTLFSGEMTPTQAMSAGLAELKPQGGRLASHRHAEPEIYFVVEGSGVVTVSGVETRVAAGAAVFIPSDAEHGIRNDGDAVLRFFYVFPVDRFPDVVYRFS
ncbi:cupin domain-containing protein [Lichenibacterium dinghuense]|uniref:cupin domain-containing protein n=1 Tax=Lichenibacterium dinghuense TaxID=2895977 RepID=UPI001F292476|nr:cupin domain-containing protein [Lichenibacterium sp. 6Y81]